MSTFSNNRFQALLGDEETETDKLGNIKPVEKTEQPPLSKREALRKAQHPHRVAVSPPSRRGKDRGANERTETARTADRADDRGAKPPREGREPRGRQFDRHSGTGIYDNEKKIKQGWGNATTAEQDAANDTLSPDDPAAEGENVGSGAATPAEPNVKTLDEYLAERRQLPEQFQKLQARSPNEGADDSQWKNAIVFERSEEDEVYFGGKESTTKTKTKSRKEKVYLEIDQPAHRPRGGGNSGRRGGASGDRRGGGRGRGRGRGRQGEHVNLSDASAFPTLGA